MDTIPVVAGRYLVGVRPNTPELRDLLVQLLGAHVAADIDDMDPSYSLRVEAHEASGVELYHLVHRNFTQIAKRRSPRRATEIVLDLLDSYASRGGSELIEIGDVEAIVSEDAAVLVSRRLRGELRDREPALRRSGWQVLERPVVHLDPQRAELVPPPEPLDRATEAGAILDKIETLAPADEPEPALPDGPLPLRGWLLGTGGPDGEAASLASAVHRAAAGVDNMDAFGPQAALEGLAAVFQRDVDLAPLEQAERFLGGLTG